MDDDPASLLPSEVTLYPAAPNPFNATTTIRYFLPRSENVRLTVNDSAGMHTSGKQSATLNGTELAAGVYLLRLEVGEFMQTRKVVLLK